LPVPRLKAWPPEPPPRIDAAATLAQLRDSLREWIDYVVDLGFRPSMIATAAGMSEKGLNGYRNSDWNPTPSSMIRLNATMTRMLPAWIEQARQNRGR
jgi:hypothetical protein